MSFFFRWSLEKVNECHGVSFDAPENQVYEEHSRRFLRSRAIGRDNFMHPTLFEKNNEILFLVRGCLR